MRKQHKSGFKKVKNKVMEKIEMFSLEVKTKLEGTRE